MSYNHWAIPRLVAAWYDFASPVKPEIIIQPSYQRLGCRAFFNVLLPIFLGAVIYVLWRSPHLLVFEWLDRVGLMDAVEHARHFASTLRSSIPQVILYSLPDALWVYSFTAALALIWERDPSMSIYCLLWLLLPMTIAMVAEFGQSLHWVPGTFDWLDVLSYFIAGTLGSKLLPSTLMNLNEQKDLHAIS